jgi:hypothetical protein
MYKIGESEKAVRNCVHDDDVKGPTSCEERAPILREADNVVVVVVCSSAIRGEAKLLHNDR